jgi:predicted Zn-dependent protease
MLAAGCALACASPAPPEPAKTQRAAPQPDALPPEAVHGGDGYLAPNAEDSDGTPAFVHYTPEDMPLRVDVQLPKLAARYASREQTNEAVIGAIRSWEKAIQPALPWFKLEIVSGQRDADIVVEWKSRITGDASGWGGTDWSVRDGRVHVRGHLEYATKPCLAIRCQLDLGQLTLLVTHEFGHTLGLRHCLDCDSAMNYSWETLQRTFITEVDVRTIRALYEKPNGIRVDGKPLLALQPQAGAK